MELSLDQVDKPGRRELITTRWLYIIWAVLGVLVVLALCYLVTAMVRSRAPEPVRVGQVADYAPNSVTLTFVNADFTDPETQKDFSTLSLEVVRDPAGAFIVFFARSTDPATGGLTPRQCVVQWNDAAQQFQEPCGGSKWTRDGKFVEGPAPRDLDRFPTQVAAGELEIQLNLIQGAPHP